MTWLQEEEVQEDRAVQEKEVLEDLAQDANAHLEVVLVKPKDEQLQLLIKEKLS